MLTIVLTYSLRAEAQSEIPKLYQHGLSPPGSSLSQHESYMSHDEVSMMQGYRRILCFPLKEVADAPRRLHCHSQSGMILNGWMVVYQRRPGEMDFITSSRDNKRQRF